MSSYYQFFLSGNSHKRYVFDGFFIGQPGRLFLLSTYSLHESGNPTLFRIENGRANMFLASFQLCL